jgi:hypothetical protein
MVSLPVHGYSADTDIPHYEATSCSWLLPPLLDLWTKNWRYMSDRVAHIQPWLTLLMLKKTSIIVLILYFNTKAAFDIGDARIFPCMDWLFPGHNEKPTLITGDHGVRKIFIFFNFVNNFIKNFLSCHSYGTISIHATFLHIHPFPKFVSPFPCPFQLALQTITFFSQQSSPFPHVHQFSLLLDIDVIGYFPHSFWKTSCATQTHLTLKGYLLHMPHMILKVLVALFFNFKRIDVYLLPFFFNHGWTQQDRAWFSMWLGERSSITSIYYRILHTRWLFFKRKTYNCQ